MKKHLYKITCTFLMILISSSLIYATAPDTLWTKTIGDDGSQNAFSVYPTTDGGFMLGGYTTVSGYRDFYMVKTDGDGELVWTKEFGQDDRFESATCMIETNDGGYMLAGARAQDAPYSSSTDIYIIKTNADGEEIWSSIIGFDSVSEGANCIAQTTDGGYIMCGSYWATSQTGYDVLLVKTDAMGLQEWRQVLSFEEGKAERGLGVIQAADGGYLVTGKTQAFAPQYDDNAYILKTDMVGELVWLETYGSPWPWYESTNHIMHTSDGGYLICGNQDNDGIDKNWYVVKADGIGNQTWSNNTIGGTYHDGAFYSCETFDEGYVVAGNVHQDVWKAYITKFNVDGDTLWTKMWGTGDDNSQYTYAIQQLEDGGFITVGSTTTNTGDIDIYLSRLSPETVGIHDSDGKALQNGMELLDNYPNPFSSSTLIPYKLNIAGHISISIYNAYGQKIEEIINTIQNSGEYEVEFNGESFPSGIYYCVLYSGNTTLTKKVILQKRQ